MIARVWKGTPLEGRADDYLAHLRHAVVPELARIPGFRGVEMFKQRDGDGHVVVITRWESMDAIVRFAGADPNVAVVAEPARQVLARWDEQVTHYDVLDVAGS